MRCTGCGELLPLDAFGWRDRALDRRHSRCTWCRREYQRQWYEANAEVHRARQRDARRRRRATNRAIIDAAKDVPCPDCGGRFHPEQMDFDHVRGTKAFNIGNVASQASAERMRKEIAKCDVVCAVCHRIRTARRSQS